MKSKRSVAIPAFALSILLMICIPTLSAHPAHHSRIGYSLENITLKGIVSGVSWRNPHVWINFDVTDAQGKVAKWSGELSSTTSMMAAGLGKDTLKLGDEIIVTLGPADSGEPRGLIAGIKRPDGRVVLAENYRSDTR